MNLLNLGCGDRYLKGWTNLDFVSNSPDVVSHNLLEQLPLSNNSFDVAYSSHVLEHFTKAEAKAFLDEVYRVLKPGGILRIAVPDLERFASGYLDSVRKLKSEKSEYNRDVHDWSVIELIDQMVRTKSGGEMLKYWSKNHLSNEDYIEGRLGYEFRKFRNYITSQPKRSGGEQEQVKSKTWPFFKLKQRLVQRWFNINLTVEDIEYLRFRKQGELHKWMYDEYSLSQLLEKNKFLHISRVHADTSRIPNWSEYSFLDIEGPKIRKPDSLFMEAEK